MTSSRTQSAAVGRTPERDAMSVNLWEDCASSMIAALLRRDPIVILPIGSIEQHGTHLPISTDCLLVEVVATGAAHHCQKTRYQSPVMVMPTVWMGLADHHMSYAGTLTHDFASFRDHIAKICTSLDRTGVRRIFLLNGHGSYIAALRVITEGLAHKLSAIVAEGTYFRVAASAFEDILEKQSDVQHACETETSMMLALRPDLVDITALQGEAEATEDLGLSDVYRWRSIDHFTSNGAIGSLRAAIAKKGAHLLQSAACAVADAISNPDLWTPERKLEGVGRS